MGLVSSIDELNEKVTKEVGADTLYHNSPEILAHGIGVCEDNLWFPEWVRFLDYKDDEQKKRYGPKTNSE